MVLRRGPICEFLVFQCQLFFSLRLCLQTVRRSKKGALHIIALCCTSFCMPPLDENKCHGKYELPTGYCDFLSSKKWPRSSGTHQRSILFPHGNRNYNFVRDGNRLASRFVLLIYYSLAHMCRFLLEQPGGSTAELYPRLSKLMSLLKIWKTQIWGGAYATDRREATPKRHLLYSNDRRLLQELNQASGHLGREELAEFGGDPLVKRYKKADGSTGWTGNGETLTKSQSQTQDISRCCLIMFFLLFLFF